MIKLSQNAIKELTSIINDQQMDKEKTYLRLGISGGGCSGFKYTLDLSDDPINENDETFEQDAIKITVDSKSLLYLSGTEIDFKDELNGRGFVFNNPNHTTCGCGSSFNV